MLGDPETVPRAFRLLSILLRALAKNRGLVHLDLHSVPISDENWMILCETLQAHPTLTSLNLIDTRPRSSADDRRSLMSLMQDEQKAHRTRLLTEMMQQNTLHTIELSASERDGGPLLLPPVSHVAKKLAPKN
jgi:hypothetical protein